MGPRPARQRSSPAAQNRFRWLRETQGPLTARAGQPQLGPHRVEAAASLGAHGRLLDLEHARLDGLAR